MNVHQFDQPFHILQFAFGETLGEPVGLFPKLAHPFELLYRQMPRLIGGFAGAIDVAFGPGIAVAGFALIFASIDEAAGKYLKQVALFDQIAAGLG